jgi:2-(1,2-epoxy-1,2-dihydrophenyl)acetyl-CoA isomerase
VTALDTGSEDLLAEVDEGVAVITMNRPSRRNAFSDEMVQALGRVLAEVEVSDEVRCVVLTGAGGAFSAGRDVTAMAEQRLPLGRRPRSRCRRAPRSPRATPRHAQPALFASLRRPLPTDGSSPRHR